MTILWTVHWSHIRSWRISIPWSTRCGDWLQKQSWSFFFPKQCVHTEGFLGVKGRGHSSVLQVPLGDVHVHADCQCSHKMGGAVLLARRARFFELWLCSLFVAGVVVWGHFEVWTVVLRDSCRTSEVLLEVISRGRCSTSDTSGPFCVARAVLCRPRQNSSWDLGKTSFLTFPVLPGARNVLQTSSKCSRNPLVILALCQIWYRSRNLLGTLCASDPSRCGAVRIFTRLAQPSDRFVVALCWF